MTLLWKPNGTLDVATAATDLPETVGPGGTVSEALQRCKNLSVDRRGRLDTRPGSTRFTTQMADAALFQIEQGGNRYTFSSAQVYRNEASIDSGYTASSWDAIKYNAFNETTQQIFALNAGAQKRIDSATVYEWGIDAPTVAASLGVGSSTGLTGDYKVRYTYARLSGSTVITESNPSPESDAQTLSDESLSVTFTASSDAQVTHVRVYRTLAGGGIYYHDQNVAVGTTTLDTTTIDASLGAEVATNHDRPPAGTLVAGPFYGGTCFIAKGNLLYYCLAKQPEYWPATNFIEVGPPQFPIKAIVEFGGQAYALTKSKIWYIQGTSAGQFRPVPMRALAGAPNQFGALGVEGRGIYHIGPDGLYLYSGGRDRKVSQAHFEPLFIDTIVNGMAGVSSTASAWVLQYQNRLYFHYGNGSALVINLDNERSTYYKWDMRMDAPAIDHQNDRLLAADAQRYNRVLEDRDATDDAGTGIAWESESKDYTLQTRAHFPRWAKYDVDGTATGAVVLDGVVHQEHALTVSRDTVRRLIKTGNGERCSLRISGTGAATVYAAEMQ